MDFVHLHLHSQYSLLDGMINIKKLCARVKELGMSAVALTDHGNLFAAVQFYKEAKAQGIKPIIGIECYVAPESRFNKSGKSEISGAPISKYHHLLLLAKNTVGYQNLMQLSSISYLEGYYYKPRIDKEVLIKYREGLICCSACLAGEIPRLLQAGNEDLARQTMQEYAEIFGSDYYYEIMRHGIEGQEEINQKGIALARSLNVPIVATNDAHYLAKEDVEIHNIVLNIQNKSGETHRAYETGDFYVKSPEEMTKLFHDIPEAIANTTKIANDCNFDFEFGKFHFPTVPLPQNMTEAEYLAKLAWEGFKLRYPQEEQQGAIGKRLQYELDVINKMGFPAYFLIVQDFVTYAKDALKIAVGPARGSVGGSVVAYCLRIIDIDPIEFDLMFERFLNPERVSMPDIDMDFSERNRQQIIDYVVSKYGEDCVSQIVTVNLIKARTAIRDVGRVLNIPLYKVDAIAKATLPTMSLTEFMALDIKETTDPELVKLKQAKEAFDTIAFADEESKRLCNLASRLEGAPRHVGVHAAGVVIADKPLATYVPLAKEKDVITTQYDMTLLEPLGLIKMDFLGLRTMDTIYDAIALIKKRHNVDIELEKIPKDDKKTCEMLCQGHTKGVFQADGSGIQKLIIEIAPKTMYDCVPIVALYRPGPLESGMVQTYIDCRHGRKPIEAFYPTLKPITDGTYGILLYQETVMKTAQVLSGFSVGEADELRKAIGKKDPIKLAKLRKKFVEGAIKTNPTDPLVGDIANDIYTKIEFFGRYCFNKAHSAAYGLIMYWTAYLKANYPTEYMCALLTTVMGSDDQFVSYLREAKRMGISVLSPDVNKSLPVFAIEGENKLRFGLAGIKGISEATLAEFMTAREEGEFKSFYNFIERFKANTSVIKALILAGALDCFKHTRRGMLEKLGGDILKKVVAERREQAIGQIDMFEDDHDDSIKYGVINDSFELDEKELLNKEKELMGVYLSKHPLDKYKELLRKVIDLSSVVDANEIAEDGKPTILAGVITTMKTITTKKGEAMAFIRIEDKTGDMEAIVFAKTYANYQNSISPDRIVLLEGHLQVTVEETEGDETGGVSTKSVKMIVCGVANIEKLNKTKSCYIPSPDYLALKKRPNRSGANQFRQQNQTFAGKNTGKSTEKVVPSSVSLLASAPKSRVPQKIRIYILPKNLPLLLDVLTREYVPGAVELEVCIGKMGSGGVVASLPLKIDPRGMEKIIKIPGLSCKVAYKND